MRILIVKVSALGDVVHALPVLAYLKNADPDVEIDWLVEESFAPLLEGHPLIRDVHRLRTKAWRREGMASAVGGVLATIGRLRRENFDLVLDLQGNSKSGLFTLLSGAGRRYGFARDGVREWPNLLATNRKVALKAEEHHISDRSLAIARDAVPADVASPLAGPLAVDAGARERVENLLQEREVVGRKVVVLHYGTTWETKLWPLASWRELARRLCEEDGRQILLTWGSTGEEAAAESIRDATDGRAMVWPRGTLMELAALLERADLVVGGDTGPVHIAAAVGTPTVSLFRVTDAERNGPRGPHHLRLQAPMDCAPCLKKTCERDDECGRSIGVDPVLAAIRSLLEESP